MKKRIVICADGTWNRPEKDLSKDFPTNVLKIARAISPIGNDGIPQQVFYDWGVGSYYDPVIGGTTGKGLHKNIMDCYRYIVQNYSPGDELYFFGFSRGAYTVRSLCGLVNNCGILKRDDAKLIQTAFDLYKKSGAKYKPDGEQSIVFRNQYSHGSRAIKFVGVWDTVGAMGLPISFSGFFEPKDEFYDTKLGRNVQIARHALAIDEFREDFEPTIWAKRENMDIKQVWFAGAHSDVGGSYAPDRDGTVLSDIPLKWMIEEAENAELVIEEHLKNSLNNLNPLATIYKSRKSFYKFKKPLYRKINHNKGEVLIDKSVKERWENDGSYRPKNLVEFVKKFGFLESILVRQKHL